MYNIENLNSPNYEDRHGFKPILFVLHLTDGVEAVRNSDEHEEKAVDNTFMSPASQCSAHDGIERDGRIKQYVDVKYAAWTQGLHNHSEYQAAPSPIVRNMDANPNYYSIGIECLGYGPDHGGDGMITDDQFWALCWRIKSHQEEVNGIWGHKIPLNSTYIIGHCHIDPVNRPNDPGPNFPWQRLFAELAVADGMSLADYEGRILYLRSDDFKLHQAYGIANEILYLYTLSKGTGGEADWAKGVLLRLHPIMTAFGLLTKPYDEATSHDDVANQILYLYNLSNQQDGNSEWSRQQLLQLYPYMLQNGLVNQ